jgi:putative ABC transport system permease protein
MPAQESLDFATNSKLWTAFIPGKEQLAARGNHAYAVVARRRPGVGLKTAQTELDTISARLASAYPEFDKGWSIHATPLKNYLLGDARPSLVLLFLAVGLVLLIACANVSNLFLSRGWARRREFAVRAAIGATRGMLLRQLAVESVMVAFTGGVCALVVAGWTIQGLRAMLPPGIPRVEDIRIDGEVAWFALGASLLAALLAGLAPALLSTRQNVIDAIKESSSGASASGSISGHTVLRQFLVIVEVALAAILLIAATLAVRGFDRLRQLDFGFRIDHVVALRMDFPKFRFTNEEQAYVFVQQILNGARAIPEVQSASTGLVFPLSDEVAETTFQTEETLKDPKSLPSMALANRVTPNFFETLGIPLRAGRDFDAADTKGKPPVFIVSESLARQSFGSINIIGKRISFPKPSGEFEWGEIVGVVGDVRQPSPVAESKPQIYAPYYQTPRVAGVYLLVRTKSDPLSVVSVIEERVWSIDKNQSFSAIHTIDARIDEINAAPKSQSFLLSIFGGLGFVLALVGVYGVVSYLVSLQTREIGIRMALGADRGRILRGVIGHGLKLTLCGVFIGVAGGLALTRFMSSLLFGISASDPLTYAGVAILVSSVAIAACYIPARRAARVDPMIALRYE